MGREGIGRVNVRRREGVGGRKVRSKWEGMMLLFFCEIWILLIMLDVIVALVYVISSGINDV